MFSIINCKKIISYFVRILFFLKIVLALFYHDYLQFSFLQLLDLNCWFLLQVAWIWCLCFAFAVPELGSLFRAGRICIFKSARRCSFADFVVVWIFESMHTVGLALFVFVVLPELDVVKGAMITNCVAFIPAVLGNIFI